jgi:hypothetical protein
MVKFRQLLPKLLILSTLFAVCSFAQNTLTAIRDTVTNANGSPFNGTVIISWNGFTAPTGGTIAPHSTSAHIYNGVLSVLLVPSTTASSGASYLATYNSNDGTVTWTETWQVPPSLTPLTLDQVRVPQGGTGGGPGTIGVPIPISDVINLTSTLSTINAAISSLTTTVNALSSGSGVNPLFTDGETPSGLVNGSNTTFTLAGTPVPAASLELYRNGLVQTSGVDYSLSGNTISFLSAAAPQSGDILQAYYRLVGPGQAASFSDKETPGGLMNGVNMTFSLQSAPNPALSLKLYRNGTLLQQGVDYTLSGMIITFANLNTPPHTGDVLAAYYRR